MGHKRARFSNVNLYHRFVRVRRNDVDGDDRSSTVGCLRTSLSRFVAQLVELSREHGSRTLALQCVFCKHRKTNVLTFYSMPNPALTNAFYMKPFNALRTIGRSKARENSSLNYGQQKDSSVFESYFTCRSARHLSLDVLSNHRNAAVDFDRCHAARSHKVCKKCRLLRKKMVKNYRYEEDNLPNRPIIFSSDR